MLKTLFLSLLFAIGFLVLPSSSTYGQNVNEIQLANQYLQQGENDKALALYQKLENNSKNIPLIHDKYFHLLSTTKNNIW